jgi:homoserine O-acetyltransferase/O-succinyltransferase
MGRAKAFDPSRFFIFCANVLGSPYGSASPITVNPDTGRLYGPDFPPTTIRDDVRFVFLAPVFCIFTFLKSDLSFSIHKLVLDHLGVSSVAVCIGGSMGGMAVLEWALCSPPKYIKHVIPLATSARHSAWCISWSEAQRSSVYSDPDWKEGRYDFAGGEQPKVGLAAARMCALLTYRSRDSFESRFGRKAQAGVRKAGVDTPPPEKETQDDGREEADAMVPVTIFSAQSYLRYQGDKFTARFDANCYVHITHKMDTHDIARGRIPPSPSSNSLDTEALAQVLAQLPPRALVISIQTDGLFTPSEQELLARHIPEAELVMIESRDGHDGFLLEFEAINKVVLGFLRCEFKEYYADRAVELEEGTFEIQKTSLFGEAEKDIARW